MVRGITKRDQEIFKKLGDYGVLSTPQIKNLFFKDIRKTTMLRRLRILEEKKLIRRIHGLCDGSHGWCLTKTCARRLGIRGVFRNINRNSLEHDVTLSEVRLSLQSVGLGSAWIPEHMLRYRAWEERRERGKVPENIPDGIFTVEMNGEYKAIAVELEMTEKNSERYRKAMIAYQWKQSLAMVWYLVPYPALGNRLERIWNKQSSSNHKFKWTLISEVLKNPYDIELHSRGKKSLLRDSVSLKNPAHSPAQGVSTKSRSNSIPEKTTNPLSR